MSEYLAAEMPCLSWVTQADGRKWGRTERSELQPQLDNQRHVAAAHDIHTRGESVCAEYFHRWHRKLDDVFLTSLWSDGGVGLRVIMPFKSEIGSRSFLPPI